MEIAIGTRELVLHEAAIRTLNHYTQHQRGSHEAGGIILGKLVNSKVHIVRLSIPTELDRSSRANFERHRLSAQIIINYEFSQTDGEVLYLGEWHTHPEDFPTPSPEDRKMIRQQFTGNIISTDYLLLLIKGIKELYVGVQDKTGLFGSTYHWDV